MPTDKLQMTLSDFFPLERAPRKPRFRPLEFRVTLRAGIYPADDFEVVPA